MRIPDVKKLSEEHTTPPRLKIFKVFVAVAYLGNEASEPPEKSADPTSVEVLASGYCPHQSSSFDVDLMVLGPACIWPKYRDKNRNYN